MTRNMDKNEHATHTSFNTNEFFLVLATNTSFLEPPLIAAVAALPAAAVDFSTTKHRLPMSVVD